MSWLATVVTLSLVTLLFACVQTCGNESFIRLALLLAPLVGLVPHAAVLQAFCFFADMTDECVGVDGLCAVDETSRRQEVGHKLGQILRDTPKDSVLIVLVIDGDTGCCELLALKCEAGEECPDISTLWATHLEECVLQIVLCIHAFGRELLADPRGS